MVGTSNLNLSLFASFGQSRSAHAIWPTVVSDPPVRQPSRPKFVYRARGSSGVTSPDAKTRQSSADQSVTWAARTDAAKTRRKTRSVATITASVVSFGIVLGGYAATQITAPSPQASPALTVFWKAPQMDPVASRDTLQMTQAINLDRAPIASVTPPYLVPELAAQSLQSAPQLRLSQNQPRVSLSAPALGQAPAASNAPAVVATASDVPVLARPLRVVQPAATDPFVCTACNSAILDFDGVTFAVQTGDTASATTTKLVTALAAYEVDLRTSAISVPRSEVRYYRARDAEPARVLATQYDANLIDLTWIAAQSETPRIDIILAGSSD